MKSKKINAINIALTITSCVGVVTTAIFASKDGQKAIKAPTESNKVQKVKYHLKNYWKTYLVGGLTIITNIINCSFGCYSIAASGAMISAMSVSQNNIRKAIKENVSEEDYKKIIKSLTEELKAPEGETVYYNEYTGAFTAKKTDVVVALQEINNMLMDQRENGQVYIRDFLKLANAKLENEGNFIAYQDYGWDKEILEKRYDMPYIHASINDMMERNGETESDIQTVNMLDWFEEPIYLGEI